MSEAMAKKEEKEALEIYTGTRNKGVAHMVIAQTIRAIPTLNINGEDINAGAIAQSMLLGIAPKDQLEGMLASQMIALHNMAMDCSSRAMNKEQTFEGRDMNMRHATKLMNAFTNAMNTLDKHRGKGQQKITVEHQHVQVEAGGKAIIGDVHHRVGK